MVYVYAELCMNGFKFWHHFNGTHRHSVFIDNWTDCKSSSHAYLYWDVSAVDKFALLFPASDDLQQQHTKANVTVFYTNIA